LREKRRQEMLGRMRLCAVALAFLVVASAVAAVAADEGQAEETRICPGCGAEIPVTAVFCPNCHRYLPDAKVVTEAEPAAADAAASRTDEPARRLVTARLKGGILAGSGATIGGGWLFVGLRVAEKVALGGGFGYQDYPNGKSYPISLSVRANLTSGKIAPLIYGDIGYNKAQFKVVYPGGPDPSGVLLGFGGGIDILHKAGVGLTLEAGVRFEDSVEYWGYYFPGTGIYKYFVRDKTFSYFQFGAGIVF
jgi:ribosomal protein L40E